MFIESCDSPGSLLHRLYTFHFISSFLRAQEIKFRQKIKDLPLAIRSVAEPEFKGCPIRILQHFPPPTLLFQGEQSPVVFEIRTDSKKRNWELFGGLMDLQCRGLHATAGKRIFQIVKGGLRNSFFLIKIYKNITDFHLSRVY